jgi:hypothetical protein
MQKVLARVLECHDTDTIGKANLQASKDLSLVISAPIGRITWDSKPAWIVRINERQSFCVASLNSWPTEQESHLGRRTKSIVWGDYLPRQIEPDVWNDVIFDALEEEQPPSTLWCLPILIARRPKYEGNGPECSAFGLVLDKVEGSRYGNEVLRRVGVFTVGYPDGKFFELSPMRTVTLV